MKSNNWFEFAQEDIKMAELAFGANIYTQACFHSQQATEKFLKAILFSKNKAVPKTHFLDELLTLCVQVDRSFEQLREYCSRLDDYYIPTRYPDALPGVLPEGLPEANDASEAINFAKEVMNFIIKRL